MGSRPLGRQDLAIERRTNLRCIDAADRRDVGVEVRLMASADLEAVAGLATQLGYPSSPSEVAQRFSLLEGQPDHGLFVAEGPGGEVVGWVHVHERRLLESDPFAELGGLVVDQGCRGRGVGHALLYAAERWAVTRGYPGLCVRSNVVRLDAHRFYEQAGYKRIKSQHVFWKLLDETRGGTLIG